MVTDVEIGRIHPPRLRSGRVDPLGGTRLARKSLPHRGTECVELERIRARLQDDQLQRVSGDGRRFEPQDACVVIGEPIAILGSHLASVLT
jgi:hypothetical protein